MNYRQVTVHPESRIAPNATLVGQVEVVGRLGVAPGLVVRGAGLDMDLVGVLLGKGR